MPFNDPSFVKYLNYIIFQFRQFLQTTSNLAEEFKSVVEHCLEITDINTRWLDNYLNDLNNIFQISFV